VKRDTSSNFWGGHKRRKQQRKKKPTIIEFHKEFEEGSKKLKKDHPNRLHKEGKRGR